MTAPEAFPRIIQGGMGAGVSTWRLAKTVSMAGELGVVSGTGIDTSFARRLQLGDLEGHLRRALEHFPAPNIAERILAKYFVPGGKADGEPFKLIPMLSHRMGRESFELLIVSNFAEVFLAKEGHDGLVGINYLEKIQLPTLPSLFGTMLAGVTVVLMGAGLPRAIPGVLDRLARWEPVELTINAEGGAREDDQILRLDPTDFFPGARPTLTRPKFFAIVSSDVVARALVTKASGEVDGLIVEGHTAGGHNAPPRRDGQGQQGFGPRDIPDLEKIAAIGKPFWLAGSYGSAAKLREALACGAAGIQVGTPFAFCRESGLAPEVRRTVLEARQAGRLEVRTDFLASPTGFPFKLVRVREDHDAHLFGSRERLCDMGYLRRFHRDEAGRIVYRCPAEPVDQYVKKGGRVEDTVGRQCLCNGLMATIGLGQEQKTGTEPPLVTAGQDFSLVDALLADVGPDYGASDVLRHLRG